LDKFCTDKRLMSLEAVPRQVTWLIILKATVKATPSDASGQGGPETSAICPFRRREGLTTVLGFDNSFDNNAGGRPWFRRHAADDSANTITGAPAELSW
jgi:hypothetical protein